MGKPIWLETWHIPMWAAASDTVLCTEEPSIEKIECYGSELRTIQARTKLVEAAPDLVRVMLRTEWEGARHDLVAKVCPDCGAEGTFFSRRRHDRGCGLDAALTKAGFPTEERRAEARQMIRAREILAKGGG